MSKENLAFTYLSNFVKESPPINSKLQEFYFPSFKKWKLNNGLNLILIEQHDLPKVYLRLGMNFGKKNDPKSKAGLSQLLANTQKKGTSTYRYHEIIDKIECTGGELDITVNEDFFLIYGEFLKAKLEVGLSVMSDILLQPTFPNFELEKERFKLLANLENEKSSPDFLANRRMESVLFSPHPYGDYKTEASLESITRKDLVDFHSHYFSPDISFLIISGDIYESEVIDLVHRFFSEWRSEEIEWPDLDKPNSEGKGKVYIVNRPGSQQSNILLGNILFSRAHPDYEKTLVMNKILGGSGSGRLFLHLREEKGFTYGAYSTLQTYKETGAFIANAEVRTAVTVEAIHAFLNQFEKIQKQVISEEESENAKRYLRGIFPLQNETAASIAALVLRQHLYGLSDNYWDSYLNAISQVSQADLNEMALKYIRQDEMSIIIVGDAEVLVEKVKVFGHVQVYDLDDQPLS